MAKQFLLLFVLVLYIPLLVFSQSYKGSPYIRSYTTHKYPQLTENWSILQDERGIMYFGGPGGVIQFNGYSWSMIPVSNKSNVRSLAIDSSGRIYVGAQVEFGFLEPDRSGRLVYKSLINKIPQEHRNFDDVWETFFTKYGAIFQTNRGIYIYQNDTIRVFPANNWYKYSFYVNDRYFVEQDDVGLLELKGDTFELVNGGDIFLKERRAIHTMLPYEGNDILIIDNVNGCMLLKDNNIIALNFKANKFISDNILFSGIRLKNGNYAIGTQQNGMIIMDKRGNIILHLNKKNGLQNNSVRALYQDKHLNLWLALENGIDHVNITAPFSFLNERYGLEGRVVETKLIDNKLYAATNLGLHVKPWDSLLTFNSFDFLESTKGEIRSLYIENKDILVGHHNGVYIIKGQSSTHLNNPEYGAWTFRKINNNENLLLVGHYNGMFVIERKNKTWNYKGPVKGFVESSKYIELDEYGNIWVSHANKGIWKLKLNQKLDSIESLDYYTQKDGLPSTTRNKVFKIHNKLLFTTEKGIYKYDYKTNKFYEDELLTNISGRIHLKGLYEGYNESIWFIGEEKEKDNKDLNLDNEIGNIYKNQRGDLQLFNLPFQKLKNLNIESIESIDSKFTLFSTANGVIIYDHEIEKILNESNYAIIQRVEKINQNDSIVFAGSPLIGGSKNHIPSFPYSINGLKFFVSSGYYENIEKISYKYFLQGLDKDWSEWTNSIQKEYTNLPPGQYTFRVVAKNIYGKESIESTYSFIILTPWYRSTAAFVLYSITGLIFFILLIQFFTVRLKKRNELLAEQVSVRTQEIEKQKEEIEARNKKLEVLNEEKNYLIGILSHDLKSPIHQIKGLATIFKLTSENLTTEQKETVDKIFQSTDRVTKMISEILDITAIESQTIEIKEEVVDLKSLCHEVLSAFKDLAEKKKIEMCFEAHGDTRVKGDNNYLLQVIENLVTNALKFSDENKHIFISIDSNDKHINLKVRDEGPGIRAEDMKRLFGRFQKLSSKPTGGERSTGLGLSIVKKYVEAMNGKVWCESKEGEGATFIVQLRKA